MCFIVYVEIDQDISKNMYYKEGQLVLVSMERSANAPPPLIDPHVRIFSFIKALFSYTFAVLF